MLYQQPHKTYLNYHLFTAEPSYICKTIDCINTPNKNFRREYSMLPPVTALPAYKVCYVCCVGVVLRWASSEQASAVADGLHIADLCVIFHLCLLKSYQLLHEIKLPQTECALQSVDSTIGLVSYARCVYDIDSREAAGWLMEVR